MTLILPGMAPEVHLPQVGGGKQLLPKIGSTVCSYSEGKGCVLEAEQSPSSDGPWFIHLCQKYQAPLPTIVHVEAINEATAAARATIELKTKRTNERNSVGDC